MRRSRFDPRLTKKQLITVAALALGSWFALAAMANSQLPLHDEPRAVLRLEPPILEREVGQDLELEVHLDGARDLGGFSFILEFDPMHVQFEHVALGELLGSTGRDTEVLSEIILPLFGRIRFDVTSAGDGPGVSESGVLAILTGRAVARGESGIQFVSAALTDTAGSMILPLPLTGDALVIVRGPHPPPSTPTDTLTPPPTATETMTATPTRTLTRTPTSTLTVQPTFTRRPTPGGHKYYLPIICDSLDNPGFEWGTFTGWQTGGELDKQVVSTLYNKDPPKGGEYCALLGNPDYRCEDGVPVGEAFISQQVNVPDTPNPRLTLFFRLFSQDASSEDDWKQFDRFEVRVRLDETVKTEYWHANITEGPGCDKDPYDSGWRNCSIALSDYRGQQVEVSLVNVNHPDRWFNTWTYVDSLAVQWDTE